MRIVYSALFILLQAVMVWAGPMLQITPTTFDFGWCPDNSKISAEFKARNIGEGIVPLTGVQPTCGCTASNFTPGVLGTNEETTIGLTFNTRGYKGMEFNKSSKVKTDLTDQEYTVNLKGHVMNPNAKFLPLGDGIAAFEPETKEKKKIIFLENKSDQDLSLEIVQAPAAWAKARLKSDVVKAGKKTELEIKADGPYEDLKEASITVAGRNEAGEYRVTIAIRTGQQPEFKKFQPVPVPQPEPPVPGTK